MTRLMVEKEKRPLAEQNHGSGNHNAGTRTEGEAAKRLLEEHGYRPRSQKPSNGQYEFTCFAHEDPGTPGRGQRTNFYMDSKTSQYLCHSASCGESGNLQTLEKYFGVDTDPVLSIRYKSKNLILTQYQANLTADRRELFHSKGLSDAEIDRFRLGWDDHQKCYVIPYLESRRPVAFRFYDPEKDPAKRVGPNGAKYWWEKSDTPDGPIITDPEEGVLRLFNPSAAGGDDKGRVYVCEGETGAMLLARNGLAAVAIPGANCFKHEWAKYFMHAKEIVIVLDNDNPACHVRDSCAKCRNLGLEVCGGHNPGQDSAVKLLDFFAHRARNVVLPLPAGAPKTDINEYIMRDGHTFLDFLELLDGKGKPSPFLMQTLAEIQLSPPPETEFLVEGLLPRGGRLLVTGSPKSGKSILVENLALCIASGIPFLRRFNIVNDNPTPGHRVMILDRELSKSSLFARFKILIGGRLGYQLAAEKLIVDHDFGLHLEAENAASDLVNIINANNAEVLILDTAYKFMGDVETFRGVSRAFKALDYAIKETGVSVVLTHHHRKSSGGQREQANPDQVVGSLLWTGWPNGTVLLNFKERSVDNPYDVVSSFSSFRDSAPPDPILLERTKESICYTGIRDYTSGGETAFRRVHADSLPLSMENVANVLLEVVPADQDDFLHMAAGRFHCKPDTVKVHLLNILDSRTDFVRDGEGTRSKPYVWRYAADGREESFEDEQASGKSNHHLRLVE